ncbi:hypothetical protein BCR43DRAFT_198151 [Syncephalastrum racemosum]|uniref:Uncharacterized protein n=1 Tax=Syncephalastrum racemosum TaxID=13706 RepID=A0A1X2HHR8_SYNRA|nr:hypothetical protein BCR43DRAFT_198151 [Syncephalastrum racemosum]
MGQQENEATGPCPPSKAALWEHSFESRNALQWCYNIFFCFEKAMQTTMHHIPPFYFFIFRRRMNSITYASTPAHSKRLLSLSFPFIFILSIVLYFPGWHPSLFLAS